MPPKPRVVLVSQYCYPDVASSGYLVHTLALELANNHGFEVEVLTARPNYGGPETWVDTPRVAHESGVTFRRLWLPRVNKNNIPARLAKDAVYMAQIFWRLVVYSRRDTVYLYNSNPPYAFAVGWFARLLRRQTYCTLLYDSYPEIAVWVGAFKEGGLIDRAWRRANRSVYKRATRCVVLCKAAGALIEREYGVDPAKVAVIPNWADGEALFPRPKGETDFARRHGLVEPFTLLYSGNMGLYYDFETMLGTAELLADEPFRLVLVGGGGKKTWCEQEVARRGLTNTIVLPYEPYETLNDSLNACDASAVTIAKGIEGISFPSKLYTSLAVGKAVVAIAEEDSELRAIVESNACGVWSALGDPAALAGKIRALMADPAGTRRMGVQARAVFERDYTRQVCAAHYARVLREAGLESGRSRKVETGTSRARAKRILNKP